MEPSKADRAFAQLMRDRVSQLRGNEAASIQPFTPTELMRAAIDKGAAGFRDRIALETYHKLALFRPMQYLDMVKAPTLLAIPESDDISPPQEKLAAFDKITRPKQPY